MSKQILFSMQFSLDGKKWKHVNFCNPQTAREDWRWQVNNERDGRKWRVVTDSGKVICG